jgi:hypothetical protein
MPPEDIVSLQVFYFVFNVPINYVKWHVHVIVVKNDPR